MVFDVNNPEYDDNTCMHCETYEQALEFLEYLDSVGLRWYGGDSYGRKTNHEQYGDRTVYFFKEGLYCDTLYAKEHGCKILEFDDFDWSTATPGIICDEDSIESFISDIMRGV